MQIVDVRTTIRFMTEKSIVREDLSQRIHAEVSEYIGLSQDQRLERWTRPEFVKMFPKMTIYMLSPGGMRQYSQVEREEIFRSGLDIFSRLPAAAKKDEPHNASANFMLMDDGRMVGSGTLKSSSDRLGLKADSLLRTNLACILLLGMSCFDDKKLSEEVNKHDLVEQRAFEQNLNVLLLTANITSRRISENPSLQKRLKESWHERIVALMFNLPQNKIDDAKGPKQLPSVLGDPDSHQKYPEKILEAFLQYVIDYTHAVSKKTAARDRRIGDLIFGIGSTMRSFSKERQERLRSLVTHLNDMTGSNYKI